MAIGLDERGRASQSVNAGSFGEPARFFGQCWRWRLFLRSFKLFRRQPHCGSKPAITLSDIYRFASGRICRMVTREGSGAIMAATIGIGFGGE